MRIGIDCRLPYYQMGGISQYVLHLLPALAEIDTENSYAIFRSRKDSSDHIPKGAQNFRGSKMWTPCHHRYERWALGIELLSHKLDLFHSPDFIPPAMGAQRRVITVHDLNFVHYPEFLTPESRRYYLDQIEWAVQAADHIIADSDHTRRDLISILNVSEDRISTVYLAANPVYQQERTASEIRQVLESLNLEPGFLLFVGTVSPRKNVGMLINIYTSLVDQGKIKMPLVLVGSKGWLSEELFKTLDNASDKYDIRHLEGISDFELACLYSSAVVLLLPSFYEGFGLPVLEAMHCGCPVISSDRGSLPEVVGEAGIMLEPEDENGWEEAIMGMISDEFARENASASGKKQAASFSWRRTAEETLAIYKDLLER